MKIGLLALQGDYARHEDIIKQLGWETQLVRYPQQLDAVDGLVIPGGESTTMTKLIKTTGFRSPILDFASNAPILGTCAGLIMLGNKQIDAQIDTLELIDVEVERNAYGRQVFSFDEQIQVNVGDETQLITATFIRAPKITATGANVEILASHNGFPAAVRQGRHIGLTFHPELDDITLFHEFAFYGQGN